VRTSTEAEFRCITNESLVVMNTPAYAEYEQESATECVTAIRALFIRVWFPLGSPESCEFFNKFNAGRGFDSRRLHQFAGLQSNRASTEILFGFPALQQGFELSESLDAVR
jgi:hypothetical protein